MARREVEAGLAASYAEHYATRGRRSGRDAAGCPDGVDGPCSVAPLCQARGRW